MTMENKPLLQVKDLTVTFGERHNKFTAVKNVSFDIFQGETFGLVGESGSGKTTIGRTVIRINPAASGEILYDGERISGRISREKDREVTRKIQMIFQDPMASLNERAKVDYIVSEGLYNLDACRRKNAAKRLRRHFPTWDCCRNLPAVFRTSSPAGSASASASPARLSWNRNSLLRTSPSLLWTYPSVLRC